MGKYEDVIKCDENEENHEILPDWMKNVIKKMHEGDLPGMRTAALPALQHKLIELAHEAEDERISLAASQFVMGQAGQGVQNTVSISHKYEELPEDQLLALLRSKIEQLEKLCPGFSLEKLFNKPPTVAPKPIV